jgi:hypothetical protein
MPHVPPGRGAELGKKATRFAVTVVGLLSLRGLLAALPMLQNPSTIGNTFLSPLVLANAIVDTLILITLISFGLATKLAVRELYPRAPDLSKAALLAVILLVLVLAYNLYQLPIACVLISPQGLVRANAGQFPPGWEALGLMVTGVAELIRSSSGATLAAYQSVAVGALRQSPDWYGWIFLILCAGPIVGLVRLGSQNLDAISELVFHRTEAAAGDWQRARAAAGGSRGPYAARAGKELSSDDMERLGRLKSLLDAGAITQSDFDTQKKRILEEPVVAEEPAELQKLKQLLDVGALTREEYEVQKHRFLDRL